VKLPIGEDAACRFAVKAFHLRTLGISFKRCTKHGRLFEARNFDVPGRFTMKMREAPAIRIVTSPSMMNTQRQPVYPPNPSIPVRPLKSG